MYSRFHLDCKKSFLDWLIITDRISYSDRKSYFDVISEFKKNVSDNIESFILQNNVIDASKMQSNWFASINCSNKPHVFLSHKHRDKECAENLAVWLYKNFKIISFIDGFIWKNCYQLLHELDKRFCLNDDKSAYSYEKRNYSTAHVHMMLANALTMMVDQCECFIWLDLNNDDCFEDQIALAENESVIDSAWIYHEITTAQMIQRKDKDDHRLKAMNESSKKIAYDSASSLPTLLYHPITDKLSKLDCSDLKKWRSNFKYNTSKNIAHSALDSLYDMKGITDKKL